MRDLILTLALLTAAGSAAVAAPERLEAFDDWAVFVSDEPRECFAVSRALAETGWPEAEGAVDSQILVTFRPDATPRPGEVSVWAGGRAIAPGTTLTLTAGDADLLLFTDGAWAWPPNSIADGTALDALSAADTAEITLLSSEMTPVALQFSLAGFAAAVDRARLYCETIGAGI